MGAMPFGGRIGSPLIREYGNTPRFSGIWTPDDAAAYTSNNAWTTGVSDVTYSNVVYHTHCEGFVGSIPFNHCGRGAISGTIGNPVGLGTTQVKFGRTSFNLTGGGGAYSPSHAHYAVGTADFCVRGWIYCLSLAINTAFFDSGTATWQVYISTLGALRFFAAGVDRIVSANGAVSLNTLHYVELSRVSGTSRLFLNGTQVGSDYTDANSYVQNPIAWGVACNAVGGVVGYMDEMQFVVGQGVNTTNYSIPTAPFADQ